MSFEDPYETSYRANVLGCRNALTFSLAMQETPGSSFVNHITIETSYIHGRKRHTSNFPGDPTAELNLVPVDRVAAGILAALTAPEAIGQRIHLATDNRVRSEDMLRINREELGVAVRLADPTIYRNLTLPVVKSILLTLNEPRLADGLERLGTIFGGYSEWGQLIHSVGNDVRILGLPIRRPEYGPRLPHALPSQ